jgi:D-3-phosphoglycerate dehydrogenase
MRPAGTVLITTPELAGAADALLKEAGLRPFYVPKGTTGQDLPDLARAAQAGHGPVVAVISRSLRLGSDIIGALPDLRIISKHGAGVDNIDMLAAAAAGICVTRTSGSNARSVAEHALALILAAARHLVPLATSTAAGDWERARWRGEQLGGKALGLVGFGQIGRELAAMGRVVCGTVLVHDPFADADDIRAAAAEPVTLAMLRARADIVSLHCPLTEETRSLVDAPFLAAMRPGAMLVNTARGEIVDEAALLAALESGHISAAGLDSLCDETPGHSALRHHPRAVITPHVGGSTRQAMEIVAERAAGTIVDFLAGKPVRPADRVC